MTGRRLGTEPLVNGERIRRRYGEGEAAVDALRGVSLDVALEVGSGFEIKSPTGDRVPFTVRGLEEPPSISKLGPLVGKVTIAKND
jgi:hypothetical protein